MKTRRLTYVIALTTALTVAGATAPALADLAPPPAPEGTPETPGMAPETTPASPGAGGEEAPAAAPEAAPAEEKKKRGIGVAFWMMILAVFIALGTAYAGTRGKKAE